MRSRSAASVLSAVAIVTFEAGGAASAGESRAQLAPAVRQRCLTVLETGLRSKEFWPSMHAAEALTQAGRGEVVLNALKGRIETEKDDQRKCGLAVPFR